MGEAKEGFVKGGGFRGHLSWGGREKKKEKVVEVVNYSLISGAQDVRRRKSRVTFNGE